MISSGYNPQGGNQLSTSGLSFAPPPGMGGNLPFDPTAAIREKLRREAEQTAIENRLREREMRMREQQARSQQGQLNRQEAERRMAGNQRGERIAEDPLAALKEQDRYEMSLRNAAMRPTGLGPNMIPGMAVDPNRLPSRLRPSGSSFQGTPGPSMAGLSLGEPEAPPSSHRGFDYADPYSQNLIQRASFGGQPVRR